MEKKVSQIPNGFHTVTPYLRVNMGKEALKFYKKAFGAKESLLMETPDGRIGHAEIRVGDSSIMVADSFG